MIQLIDKLKEELRMPVFLKQLAETRAVLYRQVMATTEWRRPEWDHPLDLCGEAEVMSDNNANKAPVSLSVNLIGGHSGYHAYLYLDNKLLLESSSRADAIGKEECENLEQAARDLHRQAQRIFGIDLCRLFQDLYPVNIHKKASRRIFWLTALGVLAAFVSILVYYSK